MSRMITARSKLHTAYASVLALSVTFLFLFWFVNQISLEPLNGFAPNSQEIRVLSFAGKSSNVKFKGQRSKSPGTKNALCTPITPIATEWNALAANNVMQHQMGPFRRCRG